MTAVLDDIIGALGADPLTAAERASRDTDARLATAIQYRDVRFAADVRDAAAADVERAKAGSYPGDAVLILTASLRNAERAVGLTIRAGQAAGEVRAAATARTSLPSPVDLAGVNGRGDLLDLYAFADADDDAWTAAIQAAQAEGNLSRNAVRRKLAGDRHDTGWVPGPDDKSLEATARRREIIAERAGNGHTSRQIGELLGIADNTIRAAARKEGITITADEVITKTHRRPVEPLTAARDTVIAIAGLADGTATLTLGGLDPAQAGEWAASLTDSLRVLNRFARQLKEIAAQ